GLLSRFPAFSPDGTRIAMARLDDRDFRPLGFICRRDGSIIHTLKPGKEMVASPHLSFSPDGKLLAWYGATDRLLVWDTEGGTIAASPRSEADTSIAFHRRVISQADTVAGAGGKYAVEMRRRKVVRWDLASGAMDWRNHLVPPQGQEVFGLRGPWPSPGGDRIIYKFGTYAPGNIITESILMFDAKGDTVPVKPQFRREAENFGQYYHFSPDGSMVANLYRPTEFERHIKIWTRDGNLVRSIRLEDFPHALAFSPDWTRIGMVYPDGTAVIRNIEGRVIRTFPTNRRNANQMFTPDFRSLVTVDHDFTVSVFSMEDGRKLREFSGGPRAADQRNFSVMDMDISPDGKKLLADSVIRSGTIGNPGRTWNYNLIDLETGRWKTMNRGMEDEFSRVRMFFSPDGQGFASYALNLRHVNLWDREGNHVKKIEHLRANVRWAQYTPDGKYLLVSQRDGSHRLINLKTWEYIMFLEDEGEWIVYTADGYFDGSPGCGRLVAMVQGLRAFGVEQFALKFNRPDIILRRIGLGSRETIDHFYNQYLRRLRRMGLAEGDLSDELHVPVATIGNLKQDFGADRGRVAELRLHMKDTRHPLAAYQVYVNEVPVFGEAGKAVSGREALVTERVELANGRNKIEVSCRNRRGAESLRALAFAEYRTPAKGDLYFIGIGVSKYRDPSLDLKYAHKDALDLGKAFGRMGTMYDRVHVKTFLDAEVTAENIRKSREFMKDAKVDDTAVLFVAGHGLHDTDRESTYYYLTHDADVNRLKETAADFDLLEDIFHGIAPRNRLLLMDTCESGEGGEALADAPAAGSRGIRARTTRALSIAMKKKREGRQREFAAKKDRYIYNDLKRRTGAIVFSSSRGSELSYESDEYRNGLFTKEIIEGLSGKADADGDGKVSSDELRAHVARSVPKLSGGRQHPTVDRDNLFIKINLPKVR
nr:caspase family protein [Spirochaetota bacterium]